MGKKNKLLPISIQVFIAVLFLINGIWLLAKLSKLNAPFWNIELISVWFAGFASVYCGLHIIMVKFKHNAVKSLL
ncbi:hypothetical protein J4418_04115 [Candidatus Woesearchaeota archaeon]|nr:hypothetical protein [Candidatus Woesearchaeota archaeon]